MAPPRRSTLGDDQLQSRKIRKIALVAVDARELSGDLEGLLIKRDADSFELKTDCGDTYVFSIRAVRAVLDELETMSTEYDVPTDSEIDLMTGS